MQSRPRNPVPTLPILGALLTSTLLTLALLWPMPTLLAEQPAETATVLDLVNARTPGEGLLTGGQPTEGVLEAAAADGYRTVVNLRSEAEELPFDEKARAEELGMGYVHIPIAGADDLTEEHVRQLAELLADGEKRPMLLHCASGNRVGALLALKASWIDGIEAEKALEIGLEGGLTRLEPRVRELLGLEPASPES